MSRVGFAGIIVYVPHGAASLGTTPTAPVDAAPAWARPAAVAALVTSEAAVAVAAWALAASRLRWDLLLTSYAVTNAWMAATFAPFGALVASSRPRLVVGWLFCGFALCYGLSTLFISLAIWRATAGGPTHWSSTLGWLGVFIWTPAVAVFFPLIILLFPSGHLPGPRWRWLAGMAVVLGGTWLLGWAFDPSAVSAMPFVTYRPVVASGAWGTLAHGANNVGNVLVEAVAVTCLLTLVWRWQCSRDHERAQLSWLVAGATSALLLFAPTAADEGALWSTLLLLGVPVLPLAATIAVLRHQLLGIDLVINRTLVYLTLSAALLACYIGVVELSAAVVGHHGGFAGPLVAAAVVAVAFSPARQFFQRRVDTVMFGSRRDPSRALSEVTAQLQSSTDDEPEASLRAVSQSLHLPDLALVTEGRRVGPPSTAEGVETIVPLRYGAREVGQLMVTPRRGQTRLDASDLAALRLVAVPIASAVYALQLTKRLQQAQDQERRRLHRDLHDGLGPMLTAMALRADAAGNLSSKDGAKAHDLMAEVGDQARQAIAEVRRISHDLRPPSLDQLGLLGALAREAGRFGDRPGGEALAVTTDFPTAVPRLGLEVENAAYRIVTEALTNIARHSGATAAVVRVRAGQELCVEVLDNGAGGSDGWAEGFGIASMRARASDVGGQLCAGPIPSGGRVWAKLPLGSGSAAPA